MDPRHQLSRSLDKLAVDPTDLPTEMDIDTPQAPASSGVTIEGLKQKLTSQLGAIHVEIEDMSGGCGQMYEAIIVSPAFAKKTTLARHRLVNGILKEEIAAIHAWTAKCHTPEEWEKKRPQ
ncbi:bola domain-containing protein [Aaosphaeria arxii CBS 175.79]|uniref:Bola domain-containing protein n=1 Tax=Aaosphaeria arxii CBS 175.79 TaxID=1450172 RepID=A0A6A5XGW8_9PLEO|nr:bola domain-containing protein [Aaosphaeria arxii CBS 175.79]KAF2012150.1 bola domain-containing protein [Aaosphaeria arxii CBS 175.79]